MCFHARDNTKSNLREIGKEFAAVVNSFQQCGIFRNVKTLRVFLVNICEIMVNMDE